MAAPPPRPTNSIDPEEDQEEDMLDASEAAEEILEDDDADHPMDSDPDDDDEDQVINLQNDSIAHFDHHKDSLFSISAHPLDPSIIATGSGDDTTHIFSAAVSTPLLPTSYESNPSSSAAERTGLSSIAHLTGHTDSVTTVAFSLPNGEYLITAGMDGRVRVHSTPALGKLNEGPYKFLTEAQEVEEVTWLLVCPHKEYLNTFALGASDGSVWVYTIDKASSSLQVLQAYYLHTATTTAGAWSANGSLLASVAEDSTLFVYDVFGDAAAANVMSTGQALISLGPDDQRFAVEGGLYSLAFSPSGAVLATGGAGGIVRIVGLPVLGGGAAAAAGKGGKAAGGKSKAVAGGGSKQASASGQVGQILASLQAQSDGIETLSFAPAPLTLLATGSVDGSIALFDTSANFALRRLIRDAQDGEAVVQVSFADKKEKAFVLTSCGLDGVVRRWDTRGGSNASSGLGMMGEWKGHRGGGDGGGVMGFVVSEGRVVTAGDDSVALVFDVDR